MRSLSVLALLLFLGGCSFSQPSGRPEVEAHLFSPKTMKINSFTRLKSFSGGVNPDGIEVLVEFNDQFDDRTKAAGSIYFELFGYRPGWPDPRGARIVNPWSASLVTYDEQKSHWDRASGAYDFRLACDNLRWDTDYVLSATFEPTDGERFFQQIVLTAQTQPGSSKSENTVEPTTDPTHGPPPRYPQP
jgi:hypothetical protein